MKKVKKLLAFSMGDSNQYSTWSNVPYYFLSTLEKQGIIVERENIQLEDRNKILKFLIRGINGSIRRLGRIGNKERTLLSTVERTKIYEYFENRIINRAINKNPDIDVILFFDYSHAISNTNKKNRKVVLFCDWTIRYEIESHQKRSATFMEKIAIKRQHDYMKRADYVITLFPNVYDELKKEIGINKVFYLGNVINSDVYDEKGVLDRHYNSNHILLIGRKAYKPGLIELIYAVRKYNETRTENEKLSIDVIGMNATDTGFVDSFINYYGYLDKRVEEQKKLYYSLISNAKVVCNTTDNWIGASSIIESLYWRTPVIINPTEDIYKTFGYKITFGYYCNKNDSDQILKNLKNIYDLSEQEYKYMCNQAFYAVKDFTWDSYVDKVIDLIENEVLDNE